MPSNSLRLSFLLAPVQKYLCAQCTLHSAHTPQCQVISTLHSVHCTLHSVHCTLHTAECVVYSEVVVVRLHWCHTPKSSLLASLNCDRDSTTPLLLHIINTLILILLNFFIKIIISFLLCIQGLRDKPGVYCSA